MNLNTINIWRVQDFNNSGSSPFLASGDDVLRLAEEKSKYGGHLSFHGKALADAIKYLKRERVEVETA